MIIVFGSNVLDLFFHQADLPPRDTALFLETHEEAPGGKGANQAVAAARAGSEVKFFGALGDGGHGRQMYKNLALAGIDVSGIQFLEDVPSGLATIFVDKADGTHRIVVSQGANLKARQDSIPDKVLTSESIVLVQGELPIDQTEKLIARAKQRGAKTVMNFAPATQDLSAEALYNIDYIILNEHEADLIGKKHGIQTNDKTSFVKELNKRFDLVSIVTLGGIGSIVCDGQETYMVSPLKITPVDTVGAGDAYTGYFCAALDQNLPLKDALRHASIAGSLACTKVGAQTALPLKDEVLKRFNEITISAITASDSSPHAEFKHKMA
jgi:ribokinase